MHYLDDLKEMLCTELEEFARKGELSAGSLETIHKLTDTIKNIDKIEMFKDLDEEYSERGSYNERGSSYARKRDSLGRYSRDDDYNYRVNRAGNRHYSRNEAKDHMINQIDEMLENASSTKEREALERCLKALENA